MTPHGPPGKNARFYKIPNDCVDSIIGNKGETIKNIEKETNLHCRGIRFLQREIKIFQGKVIKFKLKKIFSNSIFLNI